MLGRKIRIYVSDKLWHGNNQWKDRGQTVATIRTRDIWMPSGRNIASMALRNSSELNASHFEVSLTEDRLASCIIRRTYLYKCIAVVRFPRSD